MPAPTELTRDQRKEAMDMARGLLLAQSQGAPYHNLRTMLESNAMIAIPHAEKVEMLKQYARMENEEPYQTTVNTSPDPRRVAAGIAGKTIAGGVGAAAMGGAFGLLRDPGMFHQLAEAAGGVKPALKTYVHFNRVPLTLAAVLGAGAAGVAATRQAIANRKYENNIRNALSSIREDKDPNPYINALLMSNQLHIDALKTRRAKILAGRREVGEAVPALAPLASSAVPHLIHPDHGVSIIRGAFGEMS